MKAVVHRFERLWHGNEEGWVALPIPEAVRQRLLRFRPDRAPEVDPLESVEKIVKKIAPLSAVQQEHILFQFVKDAPYLPDAQYLGATTCTVHPWPHQQQVAQSIINRFPERFLLCDEVGLGKTIEAGLALRQLMISGWVRRCLLLVPKSVARQWQEELYEKFVFNFPLYDGNGFADVFHQQLPIKTENPWDSYPVIIASSQLAKRRDRQSEILASRPWDLILVDEAHHARRKDFLQPICRPNRLMELLQGARESPGLKDRTKTLLLLTATPMQIHPVEVWDLLRLLGIGGRWGAVEENFLRFFSELRRAANEFEEVNWDFVLTMVGDFLKTGGEIDAVFAQQAEEKLGLVDWQRIRDLPFSSKRKTIIRELTTEERAVLLEMVKRHTPLKRFLFRNTRSLLREYHKRGLLKDRIPTRDPKLVWVDMTKQEEKLYQRIEEYIADFYQKYESERKGLGFIMTVYRRRLTSSFYAMQQSLERRLKFLRGETPDQGWDDDDTEQDDLQQDVTEELSTIESTVFREEINFVEDFLAELQRLGGDSKTERLLRDLSQILSLRETILVFTQYTDTMDYLRDRLREIYGGQVACYSGRGGEYWDGVSWVLTTKERIKTLFRDGQDIKILLCTEAASEGLNLQTCGVLINYDMPWNPMRVEQRIGRIDRIGQVHDVVWMHNYFYKGTVEAEVYRRLSSRINWFENVVGELQPILSHVARAIQGIAMMKKAERPLRLEEEISTLRQELDERQVAGLNIDEYIATELSHDNVLASPINLQELEGLMMKSAFFGHLFGPHPKIGGAYLLEWKGQELGVTFNPNIFDQYPNSLRLLCFGDDLLNDLLSEIESPTTSPHRGNIVRFSVDEPVKLISYYTVKNGEVKQIKRLTDLQAVLNDFPSSAWTRTEGLAMEQDFSRAIQAIRRRMAEAAKSRQEAERLALEEEARQLLLKTAYTELALSQQRELFDQIEVVDFSPEAITRLKRHGYPFSGLLKLVSVDALLPSPTDPYFQKVQGQSAESLRGRLNALREQAKELLSRLVQAQRSSQPQSPAEGRPGTTYFQIDFYT